MIFIKNFITLTILVSAIWVMIATAIDENTMKEYCRELITENTVYENSNSDYTEIVNQEFNWEQIKNYILKEKNFNEDNSINTKLDEIKETLKITKRKSNVEIIDGLAQTFSRYLHQFTGARRNQEPNPVSIFCNTVPLSPYNGKINIFFNFIIKDTR